MALITSSELDAIEVQKTFAKFYGAHDTVIWDLYKSNEKDTLLSKLKCLFPDKPGANLNSDKHRNDLLKAIWAQRKYCNGDLLMSIIFVLYVRPDSDSPSARGAAKYSCHPVFRIRKCRNKDTSENCCMIFVDENGRVYSNWSHYIRTNTLPKGLIVTPKQGVYMVDAADQVLISMHRTPASSDTQQALRAADVTASILAAIPAAALFLPVAGPLVAISTVAGISTSLWLIGRKTEQVIDRRLHEQPIEASSWWHIAGGLLGMGASGAAQGVIKYAAKGGKVSKIVKAAVTGANVVSLAVNGVGIGKGIVELIVKVGDGEPISTLDVLQLSASLMLFTHSAYNLRYVSKHVKVKNGSTWGQFRDRLGEAQRKIFDNLATQTRRVTNQTQTRFDIIRGKGTIPDFVKSSSGGVAATASFLPENAMRIVQNILENVVGVINSSNLENCIALMVSKLAMDAIHALIDLAQKFLINRGKLILKKLKHTPPFEDVLWRSYEILKTLTNEKLITEAIVLRFSAMIVRKLCEAYERSAENCENPVQNIKCDKCQGYYSITPC